AARLREREASAGRAGRASRQSRQGRFGSGGAERGADAGAGVSLILPYRNHTPIIPPDAFVAHNPTAIADAALRARANLWFGVIVRGDVNRIRIGARTNVQDGTMIHCTGMGGNFPTLIGDDVTIGHMVVLHGCTLEDKCMVSIKAVVLD